MTIKTHFPYPLFLLVASQLILESLRKPSFNFSESRPLCKNGCVKRCPYEELILAISVKV